MCSNKSHLLLSLVFKIMFQKFNFILLADDTKCPKGFYLSETDNTKCLSIVTDKKNWLVAQNDCRSKGGNLVTIDSEAKQAEIKSNIAYSIWIGLRKNDGERHWEAKLRNNKAYDDSPPNDSYFKKDCWYQRGLFKLAIS